MNGPTIAIATNQGTLGGGEVMLLGIATALEELGHQVLVLGPREPGELLAAAAARGLRTEALPGTTRPRYAAALLRWRLRHPGLPLWCNGLLPSLATAGLGPRIVHLHLLPVGPQVLAARIARRGARAVLVPSRTIAAQLPGVRVLANWTAEIPFHEHAAPVGRPLRIGFLGRLTRDKGVDVLARAMRQVIERSDQETTLVLAGESRFGDAADEAVIAAALAPIEEHLERPGWIAREDFFSRVDLAVFPSTWEESFGLVVAEAMAAGVPFVVTDAGALREVAGPDHPWVARRGDEEDLAAVIEQALPALGPPDRERAHRARQRWGQQFSPEAGTRRLAVLLQDLASTASREGRA